MAYGLTFHPQALKEWGRLDSAIKAQFKKKLHKRLSNPKVPKDKLKGYATIYKIKLKTSGFRLVYKVKDKQMSIFVIVINKRENKQIYRLFKQRYQTEQKKVDIWKKLLLTPLR